MSDDPFIETVDRTVGDARVLRLVLDRPEKANALTVETIDALASTVESVKRGDADVVELVGAGETFCGGADLSAFRGGEGDAGDSHSAHAIESVTALQRVVDALRTCPLAVIAAVQGRAIGAGVHLCLGADLVVASEDATFAVPEASLGIPVGGYLPTLLASVVGERTAREWILTGGGVDAATAAEAGFVTRVAAPAELESTVDASVEALAANSAFAIGALKTRLADRELRQDPTALRAAERESISRAFRDGDAGERIDALFDD